MEFSVKILVWTHKHGSEYYDASTPEKLEASARLVLEDLIGARYITAPEDPMKHIEYSGIDMELAQLDDETIDALPTQSLRDEATKHKNKLAARIRRHREDQTEWENIQKLIAGEEVYEPWTRRKPAWTDEEWQQVIEQRLARVPGSKVIGDRVHARLSAWTIVKSRDGGEYEHFEIEDVIEPEVAS